MVSNPNATKDEFPHPRRDAWKYNRQHGLEALKAAGINLGGRGPHNPGGSHNPGGNSYNPGGSSSTSGGSSSTSGSDGLSKTTHPKIKPGNAALKRWNSGPN